MKFGDLLHGTVRDFDAQGRGVFEITLQDGGRKTVAVPFAMPGDEISAAFIRRQSGIWIAELKEILAPSPDRVDEDVSESCLWQKLTYPKQLEAKRDIINRAFVKSGHEERVSDVIPSTETVYYRNRMDYCVGPNGEIGLKQFGHWNRYLDVRECRILDSRAPKILQTVRELMADLHLLGWNPNTHEGWMRYVVIRVGKNTNECMITLVVKNASPIMQHATRIIERLSPLCTTLYLGENPDVTDVSLAKTLTLLYGKKFLTEEVNGLRYDIHPNSFFQTNTAMAARLQKTVTGWIDGAHNVFDLYCGLGFFGIAAARQGATVHGFELDAQAIELAKHNAEQNGVADRTAFAAGSIEQMTDVIRGLPKPDAIIVDPPRAGLHPKALELLLDLQTPTLIYVSCNIHRFAEELKRLKTAYRVMDVKALDLFPHTPHVEVVTKLIKT